MASGDGRNVNMNFNYSFKALIAFMSRIRNHKKLDIFFIIIIIIIVIIVIMVFDLINTCTLIK